MLPRRARARLAAALLAATAARAAIADEAPRCGESGQALRVEGLGTPEDDLARVAELAGAVAPAPRTLRRGGAREEPVCAGVAFPWPGWARPEAPSGDGPRALPVHLATTWSMSYPSSQNDGLLWAGRGVSQLVSAGLELRFGALSAAVAPEGTWSENKAFTMVPNGKTGDAGFANAFYPGQIDLPQRFGAGTFAAWGPGQSYLRLDHWNVGVGISTENLWIGPGIRSSILMTNAGPGFPHVFLGTTRPGNIGIGKGEALVFWGRLERSAYVEAAGHPLVSGLVLGYEPRWIPGLHLGLGRVMLQRWEDLRFRDYLSIFQSFRKKDLQAWYGPEGNNPFDNQIASLFGRWVFPEVGLEIYGEWAREDHDWTWWTFIREPDHSQAYLLGLQKTFRAGPRLVRLHAELAHLQEIRPLNQVRGTPVYYTHGADLDYTYRGQLLGAWIGPGADSQTLAVDVFHGGGRVGVYAERVRRNDAYYWAVVEPTNPLGHDAELAFGLRQALGVGPLEVSWDVAFAYRQNRDFLAHEKNWRAALDVALPFGSGR